MLYLIRHGETAENAARILQLPHVPLSARGQDQARRLAERLARAGIRRILASDLRRAAMTAEALQAATGAELAFEPLLQERSFGDLRGRPYAELAEDPFAPGYHPPGGESDAQFEARVESAWRVIEAAAASVVPIAVVTHGLVCRTVVERHLEHPPGLAATPPRWRNTSVTVAERSVATRRWRIQTLACAAHLDDEADGAGVA